MYCTDGYDAFGLPAEQYAIEHGIHPAVSTEQNIKNFRSHSIKSVSVSIGQASENLRSGYYKWTQWIFLKYFIAVQSFVSKS